VKLSTRLLLVGAVAPVTLLATAFVLVGVLLQRALLEDVDRALLAQAAVESVSLFDRLEHAAHLHLDRSPIRAAAEDTTAWGAIYGPDGRRVIAVPDDAPGPLTVRLPVSGSPPTLETDSSAGGSGHRVLLLAVMAPDGQPHALRLAVPLDHTRAVMTRYIAAAMTVGTLSAVILFALQNAFLRQLHRRIASIGSHMARLRRGDLTGAPESDTLGDELSDLRDVIAVTTSELRATRDARERLLADAAHELRTPLAAIRTDIDVTLRRDRDAGQLLETLTRVREEAVRLSALAQQLLEIAARRVSGARIEAGNLTDAVTQSVSTMKALAEERGVTLHVVTESVTPARYDREAMQRVLVNLIDNATRYAPHGSSITVRAVTREPNIALEVEDRGVGVPESEREAVFAAFHRLDRRGAGAGLGLAIVRDIARIHGGDAWVESAEGGGARFVVQWPLRGEATP
jgi:signal transduction histidine kinase